VNSIGLKRAYSESQAPEDSIRVLMEQSLEGLKKFPLLMKRSELGSTPSSTISYENDNKVSSVISDHYSHNEPLNRRSQK
jgi:hypothetical protein